MDLQGLAITSWFRPRDIKELSEWIYHLPLRVHSLAQEDGSIVARVTSHEPSFPIERLNLETGEMEFFDFSKELSKHLAKGEYVNLMTVSTIGKKSVYACAATVFSSGLVVSIDLLEELKSAVKAATGKSIEIEPHQKD